MSLIYTYRFLILRRIVQFSILILFAGSNWFGWTLLKGNFSSAELLNTVRFSDPFAILQILASGFWVGTDVLISGLIILAFYTLLSGRMFCSWICPINPISDLTRWVRNQTPIKQNTLSFPRKIRYWIFGLSLVLSLISGLAAFEAISPIGFLHRQIVYGAGFGWAVVLLIVFFDFGITKNGWCGFLCPLGTFYSLVGRAGLLKVFHKKEKCTLCNKCFQVCPEPQVLDRIGKNDGYIKYGACTNCSRCIEVCDDKALGFSLRILKQKQNEN